MMLQNNYRGDVSALLDGKNYILRLTLGALAEMENAFGVTSLLELVKRLSNDSLSSKDMCIIIAAGLRGGGLIVTEKDVAKMACEGGPKGFAIIVQQLLSAAFSDDTSDQKAKLNNDR